MFERPVGECETGWLPARLNHLRHWRPPGSIRTPRTEPLAFGSRGICRPFTTYSR
jgi:hypothetical protein